MLIGLTKEPMAQSEGQRLRRAAQEQHVLFSTATFSQLVGALRARCETFETELSDLVDDYEEYLAESRLLQESNEWLPVFPCGQSFSENQRFNLYYEPPARPCKRNYRFIGIYTQKRVALVGMVEAIAVCSYAGGEVGEEVEAGNFTEGHRTRVKAVMEETTYYNLKSEPLRVYLVDRFVETNLRKASDGGMVGLRYLKLSTINGEFGRKKTYTTAELAELIRDKEFQ